MKITHQNKQKEWFIQKLHGLLYKLENTGNSDFKRNGEATFIKNISQFYFDKDFVFFDIGANQGEYTEMILENSPKKISAHLFEPQKSCVALLTKKFSGNESILINNFGLSDKDESVTLYKNTEQSGLASVYKRDLDYYQIDMNITETIQLKTGAKYVQEKNVSKINLLKVDVEGHEMKVFEGFGDFLNPSNIDFIQFEYGGANLDSHSSLLEIHNLLTRKGFMLCKIMHSSLEVRPYHPRLENFMYQNWVAVNPQIIESVTG